MRRKEKLLTGALIAVLLMFMTTVFLLEREISEVEDDRNYAQARLDEIQRKRTILEREEASRIKALDKREESLYEEEVSLDERSKKLDTREADLDDKFAWVEQRERDIDTIVRSAARAAADAGASKEIIVVCEPE